MTKLRRLFSFRGRTSRLGFWRINIVCTLVGAASWCGGLLLAISLDIGVLSALALLGVTPALLISVATQCRRLHDRNKSGWWLLLYTVAPLIVAIADRGSAPALPLLLLVALALAVWGFIDMGLRAGVRGSNRYGPDPAGAPV